MSRLSRHPVDPARHLAGAVFHTCWPLLAVIISDNDGNNFSNNVQQHNPGRNK